MAATNLQLWREAQAEGEEFILPSGLHICIRRHLSVLDVVAQTGPDGKGALPTPLLTAAKDFLDAGGFSPRRLDFEQMRDHLEVLNLIVKAAVTVPRIGNKRDADTITIDELTVHERLLIYMEVSQAGELTPFPPKPEPDKAGRENGGTEPAPAKRGTRHRT